MKIDKIKIKNFKCYGADFETTLNPGLNVIVGGNEAGKSTILEAINLALTGMLNGRYLKNDITPYLFNAATEREYLASLETANPKSPPEIAIELYMSGDGPAIAALEGNGNSEKKKANGVVFKITFDEAHQGEYSSLVQTGNIKSIPIEYYTTSWRHFGRESITAKSIPIKSALIDSSTARMQSGSDIYISRIIRENLEDKEKVAISQAHRQMRDGFMRDENVKAINKKISDAAKITSKEVSISVDLASQSAWESSLMTYIDSIPFQHIGKGEQCVIKTKLALSNKKTAEATVLLIEEPENHLSHSKMSRLIRDMSADNGKKQIIMTTHSSFVANKLGLEHLVLLRNNKTVRITELKASDFFKKLAGYDTLRLVLSSRCILVEGDSDELVVQRAYMEANHGKLPIEDEIDVISVGTSFLRFMELAKRLDISVAVVTDNDGDVEGVEKKYTDHANDALFRICYDATVDTGELTIGSKPYNYNTLEPKLLKENSRDLLNKIFGTKYETDDELRKHMHSNKTECALALFSTAEKFAFPDYIVRALAQ